MLKALYIKSLYNLYSYDLNFENADTSTVKFITGPNGYGKTTILEMINSLYRGEIKKFIEIPFSTIEFVFDTEKVIITQNRTVEEKKDSDEVNSSISLNIELKRIEGDALIQGLTFESSELKENNELIDVFKKTLSLYFSAKSCYLISDQRLSRKPMQIGEQEGNVTSVKNNAVRFKELLKQKELEITSTFNRKFAEYSLDVLSLSESKYEANRVRIEESVKLLEKVGIMFPVELKENSKETGIIQSLYLKAMNDTIDVFKNFIDMVEAFMRIMCRNKFANKRFQVNKRYGYRFVADDELNSILDLDALSSGEKHMLIQTYELLFEAEDGALVLIDEPEMSFHLMWQIDYLKNIKKILGLRNIQCIVSTHSPQIFSRRWELTVDLYERANKQKTALA